jgi:hypothetical protein
LKDILLFHEKRNLSLAWSFSSFAELLHFKLMAMATNCFKKLCKKHDKEQMSGQGLSER